MHRATNLQWPGPRFFIFYLFLGKPIYANVGLEIEKVIPLLLQSSSSKPDEGGRKALRIVMSGGAG
jgi:hypothetical protein